MNRQVVLHIGTHRTGTTSIQQALADERDGLLAAAGYEFPEGTVMPNINLELQFAATRSDRIEPLARFYDWTLMRREHAIRRCQDPAWVDYAKAAIAATAADRLVCSCEGLSLLRYPDEIACVGDLFAGFDVSVVMFVRQPEEFLRSYQWSMQVIGHAMSDDPDSLLYVRPDSWLVDYEARLELWRSALGPERVEVLLYEACMEADGSTVPAFFDALGIERQAASALGAYFLNARPAS